jgi:hypothetical protein
MNKYSQSRELREKTIVLRVVFFLAMRKAPESIYIYIKAYGFDVRPPLESSILPAAGGSVRLCGLHFSASGYIHGTACEALGALHEPKHYLGRVSLR